MTSEISSVTQNLLPSTRELPDASSSRVQKGQAVAGPGRTEGADELAVTRPNDRATKEKEKEAVDKENLDGTVSDLNALVQQMHRELQFTVEQDSGELVVKVIDTETDEVVRQIPPEEVLELRKRLSDAAGAIFRSSA